MSGLNKVMLIGRLGKDPETKYLPNGDCVANFSMATSESYKDKNSGEKVEKTEWHNIVAFRRVGEIAGEYLRKGSQVYIEGKLKTRKYTDKQGVEKYMTEIEAQSLQMLGGKGDSGGGSQPGSVSGGSRPGRNSAPSTQEDYEDDIPF